MLDVGALRTLARQQAEIDVPMDPAIGFGMTDGAPDFQFIAGWAGMF